MKALVESFVILFLAVLVGLCAVSIGVWLYTMLWNDLAPVFGIAIQLSMWQVVKIWLLISGIKYVLVDKTGLSEIKEQLNKLKGQTK